MSDTNEADRPRLSRRGALKAALFSTAALAAGLRQAQADPLPVPDERAMPPALGSGRTPIAPPFTYGGRAEPPTTGLPDGPFHLPPLPYAYDALEPFIDAETMHLHHDQHHAAYVKNLNAAVAKLPPAVTVGSDPAALVRDLLLPDMRLGWPLWQPGDPVFTAIRNNGGGHYNHSLFWQTMKKGGGGRPSGDLATVIDKKFGSYPAFQDQFTKAALGRFGSGWTWLSFGLGLDLPKNGDPIHTLGNTLQIESTPNQDSPLMYGRMPLLGLDVWEHAYYLKYRNRRAEYVAAWFHVIDWDFVNARYDEARKAA